MKRLVMMLVLAQVSLASAFYSSLDQNRFHSDVISVITKGLYNKSALTFKEANELADFHILAKTYEIINAIYRDARKQQVLTSFHDPVYRVVRDVLFIILQNKITLDMQAADIVALVQTVLADTNIIAAATAVGQGALGVADQQATSMSQDAQAYKALQDELAKLKADKPAPDAAPAEKDATATADTPAPVVQPQKPGKSGPRDGGLR